MATPSLTIADVSNALKKAFSPDQMKLQGYDKHPFLGWVPKRSTWGGDTKLHNIYHSGGRGKGTTIVQAQANQSAAKVARFTVTRQKLYSVASIEREFMLASRSEQGSMIKGKMALMDERLYELYRDISHNLYGDASGAIGRVATTVLAGGDTTVTLVNPEDIVNIEYGQFIGAAATATGAVLNSDEYLQVIGVNRSAGSFVVDGDATNGTDWATGNAFLLERGDAADGSSTKKIHGYQAWIPATAPVLGSDSFLGVDRGVDVTRLAGHRYDATTLGQPPLEALQDMGTVMSREGARPEVCFVNPKQRARMVRQLQGQVTYNDVDSTMAQVFYKGLRVETGAGDVLVISDPDCPVDKGIILRKSALHLDALGEVPHLVDDDGLVLMRGASTDDFEVRFAMYADLIVDEPRECGLITFVA